MDPQGELHPNWRALATIHIPLKRFVAEGTSDLETGTINKSGKKYEIGNVDGEDAKTFYEVITMTPTSPDNPIKQKKIVHERRTVSKTQNIKRPFQQKNYFRHAVENDVESLKKYEYTSDDLNSCDAFGWTALMMAACEGAEEAVRLLLQLGIKKELRDKSGKTASDIAQSKGNWKIVDLLKNNNRIKDHQKINEIHQSLVSETSHSEPFYCEICKQDFKESNFQQHLTSTVHQFNTRCTTTNKLQKFNIPPSNRGLQLMVKLGWDKESGLGPTSSGRLYPVKTVIRKKRTGVGIVQEPARVTHFEAFDLRATKSMHSDYYKKKSRNRNDIKREKQRDWKREKRFRSELS